MEEFCLNQKQYLSMKENALIIEYSINNNFFKIQDNIIKLTKLNKFLRKNNSYENIIFCLDFSTDTLDIKETDRLVCCIKKIENLRKIKKIKKYAYIISNDSDYEQMVASSICVLNAKTNAEKIEYLYDSICKYLDNVVIKNNVCGFKGNKCIAKRDTDRTMGCCHHYNNRRLGLLYEKELKLCEYQKNGKCIAQCISCKMYMCDYLVKKGYKFTTNNVILVKRYFNFFQKVIIISSFFNTKEKILRRLKLFSFEL